MIRTNWSRRWRPPTPYPLGYLDFDGPTIVNEGLGCLAGDPDELKALGVDLVGLLR